MKTLQFIYQENAIHFLVNPNDKDVMINATEMAKMFGKRTDVYLKTQSTKEFIEALERTPNGGRSSQKIIENRGHMGIYFSRNLALDFAAWLDVNFRVWIINTIDKILFSKNEPVAKAISIKQEKQAAKQALIDKELLAGNAIVKELIQLEKEIVKATALERKAVDNFKAQYKISF